LAKKKGKGNVFSLREETCEYKAKVLALSDRKEKRNSYNNNSL
jgi:hypothetical protein